MMNLLMTYYYLKMIQKKKKKKDYYQLIFDEMLNDNVVNEIHSQNLVYDNLIVVNLKLGLIEIVNDLFFFQHFLVDYYYFHNRDLVVLMEFEDLNQLVLIE